MERIYIIFAIFVNIRVNCWYDEWWWLIVYYNDDDMMITIVDDDDALPRPQKMYAFQILGVHWDHQT